MEQRPPAQAVVGDYGSGKTTLREFVAEMLSNAQGQNQCVVLVPVELWAYEAPHAAVKGVIRALIDVLAQDVNVLALRGLPLLYVELMSATGGVLAALTRAQGTPNSPIESLNRIDAIATAIGIHYVVWIEDLERFAHGGISIRENSNECSEESQRLQPIRALLYGLDELKSVSVITATTSLHMRFDLEKIARFVEVIPKLREIDIEEILKAFRDGCRNEFDVFDPADPRARTELDQLASPTNIEVRRVVHGNRIYDISEALRILCKTPRTLKQGLRLCQSIWSRLHGEIDFDDLLVMSILRGGYPDIFTVFDDNVAYLRQDPGYNRSDNKDQLEAQWDNDIAAACHSSGIISDAAKIVRKFVFDQENSTIKLQGLSREKYWDRFLSVPEICATECDQRILKDIRTNNINALATYLEEYDKRGRAQIVEAFARLIATEGLIELLLEISARRSREKPSAWLPGDYDREPPGLIPLWRMCLERSKIGGISEDALANAVKKIFKLSISMNLHLFMEVERWFVFPDRKVHRFLSENQSEILGVEFRKLCVSTFGDQPDKLATALDGAPIYTLERLIWGIDAIRSGDRTRILIVNWKRFAEMLLRAARSHPTIVLPQIACLVVRVSDARGPLRPGVEQKAEFDFEIAVRLFGESKIVTDLFRENISAISHIDTYTAAILAAGHALGKIVS